MKNAISLHDHFLRQILSDKNIAAEYFKNYLPHSVGQHLDFNTLIQLPDTYLSEDLKKSMCDIVYSCQKKGESSTVKVSLLVEHKSYPDKYSPVQIGGYIFSALQKQVAGKKPLSVVIPVLLYHGRGKWRYQTVADLFKDTAAEWKKYIPDFDYVCNDLGELADADVERLKNKFLAASILALKHSVEKEWLERNAVKLLILASKGPMYLQTGFIIYLYDRVTLDDKKILTSLPKPIRKTIMSTLDIYIEKGRKEGLEKGIEKGTEQKSREVVKNLLATRKFSISEIAELAGVAEAFVRRLATVAKT